MPPRARLERTRQLRALEMRLAGAYTGEIAKELGVSLAMVERLLTRSISSTVSAISERGEELRAIEAEKLDAAAAALWPKVKAGDARAQDTWLRNRARYADMLGLDLKPPDVTVDQSQNVIVLPAWGEQATVVEGEAHESPAKAALPPPSVNDDDRHA